jgi:hypothetical protein
MVMFHYDGAKEYVLKKKGTMVMAYVRGLVDYPLIHKSISMERVYIYDFTGSIVMWDGFTW